MRAERPTADAGPAIDALRRGKRIVREQVESMPKASGIGIGCLLSESIETEGIDFFEVGTGGIRQLEISHAGLFAPQ